MTAYEVPTIEHSEGDATDERIPLFTISKPNPKAGEPDEPAELETTYTMPGRPHVGLALAYLRMARIEGGEPAMAWLIEEAVGTEGFFALVAEPDVSRDMIRGIFHKVREVILGGLEAPKD